MQTRKRNRKGSSGKNRNKNKKPRTSKLSKLFGGMGYGYKNSSDIPVGTKGALSNFESYNNNGLLPSFKHNASQQHVYTGGNVTYGYNPELINESLGTYAGSGYPVIQRSINSPCGTTGGKKRRSNKKNSKKMKKRMSKKVKRKTKKNKKRRNKSNLRKKMKGGNVLYPSAFANKFTINSLENGNSALANPIPIKTFNNCYDNYSH